MAQVQPLTEYCRINTSSLFCAYKYVRLFTIKLVKSNCINDTLRMQTQLPDHYHREIKSVVILPGITEMVLVRLFL